MNEEKQCKDCRFYSHGCGSKYDGICKHPGLPPKTKHGRPKQIWRHLYQYDYCDSFEVLKINNAKSR